MLELFHVRAASVQSRQRGKLSFEALLQLLLLPSSPSLAQPGADLVVAAATTVSVRATTGAIVATTAAATPTPSFALARGSCKRQSPFNTAFLDGIEVSLLLRACAFPPAP